MKRRVLKKNFGVIAVIPGLTSVVLIVIIMYLFLFSLGMIGLVQNLTDAILWFLFLFFAAGGTVIMIYSGNKTNRIEYGEGKVFVLKKAQFRNKYGNLENKHIWLEEEFKAGDVVKIDYADPNRPNQWVEYIPAVYRNRADFPEAQFEAKEGGGGRKSLAFLLSKEKYDLFHYIYNRSGTIPEEEFCKKERIPLSTFGRNDIQVMKKYKYLHLSAHKKDYIEIGEGKLVSTVNGKRTELSVGDIKEMKFMEETEEVLFEMKDGRAVKVNLRFLRKKKDLFYYVYWRGGVRPGEDICRRFHLELEEHEE